MRLINIKHLANGRVHIIVCGVKVFSWGAKHFKAYKNPKLGVSYSVWDGEELLEQSIKQVRGTADYINVVWQKVSWYGNPCNPGLEKLLLKLKDQGLIDELIFFEPDLSEKPPINEINKRNVGLHAARRAGCTHFITMDTDEFYDSQQFHDAYTDIIARNLSHTCCNIVSYVTPTVRWRDYDTYFVPFIYRIDRGEKFTFDAFHGYIPCLVDPTRKIKLRKNSRFCFLGKVVMHHMTCVRKNLNQKIENSTVCQQEQITQKIKQHYRSALTNVQTKIKSGDYVQVPNKFKIKL